KSFTTGATGQQRTYVLAPECKVSLGGQDVTFDDLRRGDQFEVQYDDPDAASPAVVSITATRPAGKAKWAGLVGCAEFDDASIPSLSAATAAMTGFQETLKQRYAVPVEQTIVLANPSRIRLEHGLSDAVSKASQASQLLVVVAGRAFANAKGPVVAPK